MNEEELNEIESLDIVLNDVDDLDIGLEVISYKARVCIQELSKLVMEQNSQLQAYKDKEYKLREYVLSIIKEHETGQYDVSTVGLAIKEHKGNIENILQILNEGEKNEN